MSGAKSSHPKLAWPRSDGNSRYWPERITDGISGWRDPLPLDDKKYKLYKEKIGKHLATEVIGMPGLHNPWIDLPEGYRLFVHRKPQEDKNMKMREDVYLFGRSDMKKPFRSPAEFFPHAEWLMDTSRPLNDHSTCGCMYNKASELAKEKRPVKRSSSALDTPDPKRVRSEKEMDDRPVYKYDTIVAERSTDSRSQRRFRKGELVWFKVEPISPPTGSGLPTITHWPGLIASIVQRRKPVSRDGTPIASSSANPAPRPPLVYEHSIRPLGMFAHQYEVTCDTSELLPWAAGHELLGGVAGWEKIAREADRTLEEGAAREAKVDIPKPADLVGHALEDRWKRRWGERIRFADMPNNWDAAVLRLGVGLSTAKSITGMWSQTDKITALPEGNLLSPTEMEAMENNEKSLFQGLWYQGERIWLEDMVRMRKHRTELPQDERIRAPSAGAADRCVCLLIRLITLEVIAGANRETVPNNESWRCLLYGDLFELSDEPPSEEERAAQNKSTELPKAPSGMYYRRINSNLTEISIDVFDVAGRMYPDLFETNQSWFASPTGAASEGKVAPDDSTLALAGLRPANSVAHSGTWKDDLYVMVQSATANNEREAREHYARLLAAQLGYPPPAPSTPPKKVAHVGPRPSVGMLANGSGITANTASTTNGAENGQPVPAVAIGLDANGPGAGNAEPPVQLMPAAGHGQPLQFVP